MHYYQSLLVRCVWSLGMLHVECVISYWIRSLIVFYLHKCWIIIRITPQCYQCLCSLHTSYIRYYQVKQHSRGPLWFPSQFDNEDPLLQRARKLCILAQYTISQHNLHGLLSFFWKGNFLKQVWRHNQVIYLSERTVLHFPTATCQCQSSDVSNILKLCTGAASSPCSCSEGSCAVSHTSVVYQLCFSLYCNLICL